MLVRSWRPALLFLSLLVATCSQESGSATDGGDVIETDASQSQSGADASLRGDASISLTDAASAPDAGTIALDAALEMDAAFETDAALEPDAAMTGRDASSWDASYCTAGGIPGTCIDVAECYGVRSPTAGLCPGPADIQCCTPRYAVACDPNAVPQPNAGLVEEPGAGGCPDGMLRASTFCIDAFESSLVEVVDGGVLPWSPYFNPGTHVVRAVSLRGAVPQGYIDEIQAAAACAEAGKRMCTDAEWLRACQGPADTTYPYGNTREPGWCNDARAVHPVIQLYGTSDAWIWSHIQDPCINQLPDSLALTGSHPECVTAEGADDMMGNVHEWTGDPAGTFRGGYYVDTVMNGNGCLYVTTAHNVSHWDYSTGFRCCHD